MFERYTEKARRVIFFARYEASQYGSPYIETEHLLLGLMREDKALANRFLRQQGSIESIRKEIEARITIRERISTSVEVPLSAECKRILNMAAEEAERLGVKHVATEHLLLGILREEKCFGAEILMERGLRLSALREEFPRILLNDQLFSIDRDRFTCSGGTAPLDLMLNLIKSRLGAQVAQLISEQFILDRVRNDRDRQYVPLRAQIGVSHESLIKVAQLMEENIEKPLSLDEIASSTGLSRRQIERLFKRHLNCVPKRYYLQLRLRRARELLLQTSMPIIDITTACGFQSPPHFSRCYRAQFGCPPSAERQSHQGKDAAAAQTVTPVA